MRRTTSFALLMMLLSFGSVSWAQVPTDNPESEKIRAVPQPSSPAAPEIEPAAGSGIESEVWIGGKAPDFTLDGSQGQSVRLADLKGQWAMMVFTEDPQLLEPLKVIDDDLRNAGVRTYGVCREAAPTLRNYAQREQLTFLILSDLTRQVSQLYGMYDDGTETIQSGVVLLDPKGVVRLTLLGPALHYDEVRQLVMHSVKGA